MKKHQMTIRQYWMKYVAPQNSPLATFQPRTMQGKGGAVRPVHPAMRGVPSGMRVMRGARGGAHYTAMRRGGGFTPSLKKDNIVIGEVFSVNGGASGNEEDSNQDYYDDVRFYTIAVFYLFNFEYLTNVEGVNRNKTLFLTKYIFHCINAISVPILCTLYY